MHFLSVITPSIHSTPLAIKSAREMPLIQNRFEDDDWDSRSDDQDFQSSKEKTREGFSILFVNKIK